MTRLPPVIAQLIPRLAVLARRSLDRLSKKQIACVNNIVAEAYRRGVRPGREAA
jgi:hypothetical protein